MYLCILYMLLRYIYNVGVGIWYITDKKSVYEMNQL